MKWIFKETWHLYRRLLCSWYWMATERWQFLQFTCFAVVITDKSRSVCHGIVWFKSDDSWPLREISNFNLSSLRLSGFKQISPSNVMSYLLHSNDVNHLHRILGSCSKQGRGERTTVRVVVLGWLCCEQLGCFRSQRNVWHRQRNVSAHSVIWK